MPGVESIDQRILDFIGIGQHVGGIEAQDVGEVIDAGYVVVAHARLNHVLPFAAQPGAVENSRQGRRAQFNGSFQRLAIQKVVGRNRGSGGITLLGIKRIPQSKLGTERPSPPLHGHCQRRGEVKPAYQNSRAEPNLAPLQAFSRARERPVERRIPQPPFLTRDEDTGCMQNADQLCLRYIDGASGRIRARIANIEVLIALGQTIEMKPAGGVGEKDLRPHLGVNRLAVDIGEGEAKNEGIQEIDIRDATKSSEWALSHKMRVLATLILGWAADAAIDHPLIIEIEIGSVARTSAEFSTFKPAAF